MDERPAAAVIDELRELVGQLHLNANIHLKVVAALEALQRRQYALEQDNERMIATVRSLEKRYSELLYKLSELMRKK